MENHLNNSTGATIDNHLGRYTPRIKQTLLSALCYTLIQYLAHESAQSIPYGIIKLMTHTLPCQDEIEVGQEQCFYDNNNTLWSQQDRNESIYLYGPYSRIGELDHSYPTLTNDKVKALNKMEIPKPITSLYTQDWGNKTFDEYKCIQNLTLTKNDTDTQVPETKIIAASFVKTPFHEMIPPLPKANVTIDMRPFGLMIATNANSAKKGLQEFWRMIVKQNVRVINSLNEEFTRDEANQEDIYRYFPDETEVYFNVSNIYNISLKFTQRTNSTIARKLYIRDFKTGKLVHKVWHVHFHQWQDFMTPSEESYEDLSAMLQKDADFLFEQINQLQNGKTRNPKKLLIHCRAGRGRTGTTISILNSIMSLQYQFKKLQKSRMLHQNQSNLLRKELKLSIFSIVRRLREQRALAVETTDQYAYIYKFVDYWLSKKLKELKLQKSSCKQQQEQRQTYMLPLPSSGQSVQNKSKSRLIATTNQPNKRLQSNVTITTIE